MITITAEKGKLTVRNQHTFPVAVLLLIEREPVKCALAVLAGEEKDISHLSEQLFYEMLDCEFTNYMTVQCWNEHKLVASQRIDMYDLREKAAPVLELALNE